MRVNAEELGYERFPRSCHHKNRVAMATSACAVAASRRCFSHLQQQQHAYRSFSSSSSSSGSSSSVRQLVTFAGAGILAYAGFYTLQNQLGGASDAANNESPVSPQAEVTERAFFDVSVDNEPAGRIVMGLHGTVVPKTVKNFATLCRGDQFNGKKQMAYEGSSFHRVIPGMNESVVMNGCLDTRANEQT